MKTTLSVIGFVLFSAIPAAAQARQIPRAQRSAPARSSQPAYMQRLKSFEETQFVTKVVLKNGLTILVNEFHALPVLAISTYVKTGYADETEDTAGISEVLAQMYFRGTSTKAAGTVGKEVKALGGSLQSDASYDHMTHDLVAPAMQWKKALEIQADAFLNPLMDSEDLSRAIDLTLDEMRQQLEDPERASRQRLLEVGMQQRGLGRGPIGREETLRGLKREKVLEYFKGRYSAERSTIVVSGDVTTSEVLNEAVKLYDKARPAPPKMETPVQPEVPVGFQYGERRGAIRLPRVLFGFQAVPVGSADYPGMEVLQAILGVGQASTIYARLGDQQKLVTAARADLVSYSGLGYLVIGLETEPGNIDRSEIGLLTELELLKRQVPDDEEMERAFALLEREYWSSLETVSGRAHKLAGFEAQGDWKKMNQYLTRLRQVKAADVQRLAEKYLSLERGALVEYLPPEVEARNLTADAALRTFRELLPAATDQMLAAREKETIPAVKLPEAQAAFKFSEVRFPVQKASVLRGPELMIREDHTLPLIQMGFFFPGGRLQEKKENEGITELMLGTILRGTRDRNAREINRQMELYGAEMIPVVDRDYFGVRLSILSRSIEPALDLLAELFLNPGFLEEEVSRQKALQLAAIRGERIDAGGHARRLLASRLFKDHPYAQAPAGSEGSVKALSLPAIKDWYDSTVHNKKPVVVIIGDTQGTSLAGFFVRRFSGSRFQDMKLPDGFPKPLETRVTVEEKREAGTSQVTIGFQAPPDGDEDCSTVVILQSLLGGEGGRLMEQLIYAQGLAYDVSVRYDAGIRGGVVAATFSTPVGNEEKVSKAAESEFSKLASDPITFREYRAAVNAAIGKYWISQQERFVQITQLVRTMLNGRGLEGVLDSVTRLQDVRQDDLPELAQRVLNLDKSVTVRLYGNR